MMSNRSTGLIAGGLFTLLGVLAFLEALTIPRRMPVGLDSGFLPEIIAAAIAAMGVLLLVLSLVSRDGGAGEAEEGDVQGLSRLPVLGLNMALIAGYAAIMPYLGFLIATPIFVFLQLVLLSEPGARNLLHQAGFAIVATGLIWSIFSKGFGMILPSGLVG